MTSAGLTLTGKIGDKAQLTADLTPKLVHHTCTLSTLTVHMIHFRFSYTGKEGDTACTTGYGTCAPLSLSWACSNQVTDPQGRSLTDNNLLEDYWTI